ncbi:MAG: PAS domain S-box protein [Pirellulaceae bacterium]|nr:PAS domain S-box protein [Pirellulaceae bacterium]
MSLEGDENSALLSAVLQTALDAIIVIDAQGVIQHANQALEKLFGYAVKDVIGQNISILMPEPVRSQHSTYLSRYQQTKKASIIGIGREVLGQRKDGTLVSCDLAVSEIEVGGRTLFAGILRDMTARDRAAAKLRQAENKIIQSERLAAIGQMMTGLAHESRNALQRSRACLDMLELELETNDEQKDLVLRTKSALLELQVMYEEVQNYAAPIVLERSALHLNSLCAETWEHVTDERGENTIRLSIRCQPSPACRVDKYRISQVFRNVFENSLAVAPEDSSIYFDCRVVDQSDERILQIKILDEGPGLDAVQREKIFEPFFTTKTKGTGLGMAICRRIIEAHGGKIYVGQPANGTEIVIELPVD